MSALVCLGFGYCARFYVAEFGSRFDRMIGTSRSAGQDCTDPASRCSPFDGVHPSPELREAISSASASPDLGRARRAGDPMLAALADDIAAASKLQSIVYLSSLGVYGDHGGAWIDETAPTIPPHTRGAARVDAELAWQALGRQRNTPVAILRLGGIYGPGKTRSRGCSRAAPTASTSRATSPTASMSPTSRRRSMPRSRAASTASSTSLTASPRRPATRSSLRRSFSASRRRRCFRSTKPSERCRRS